MAPIHHHFQRKGWTETQVVVRFWLIGAMLAAMAIATVKLRSIVPRELSPFPRGRPLQFPPRPFVAEKVVVPLDRARSRP